MLFYWGSPYLFWQNDKFASYLNIFFVYKKFLKSIWKFIANFLWYAAQNLYYFPDDPFYFPDAEILWKDSASSEFSAIQIYFKCW